MRTETVLSERTKPPSEAPQGAKEGDLGYKACPSSLKARKDSFAEDSAETAKSLPERKSKPEVLLFMCRAFVKSSSQLS